MSAAALAMADPLALLGGHAPTLGVSPSSGSSGPDDYEFLADLDDDYDDEAAGLFAQQQRAPMTLSPTAGTFLPLTPTTDGDQTKDDFDGKKRSRRGPNSAAKRATHNAVERARRESLNGRFMDLAQQLPNMASVKRASKAAVVEKAIEFVTTAHSRERVLTAENTSLLQELNALRAQLGMPARVGLEPIAEQPKARAKKVAPAVVKDPVVAVPAAALPAPAAAPVSARSVSPTSKVNIPTTAADVFAHVPAFPTHHAAPPAAKVTPAPAAFDWSSLAAQQQYDLFALQAGVFDPTSFGAVPYSAATLPVQPTWPAAPMYAYHAAPAAFA